MITKEQINSALQAVKSKRRTIALAYIAKRTHYKAFGNNTYYHYYCVHLTDDQVKLMDYVFKNDKLLHFLQYGLSYDEVKKIKIKKICPIIYECITENIKV